MKIRVSDLPAEGLNISDTIPLKPLNDRLQEGHPVDMRFTKEPIVRAHVSKTASGAELRGTIKSVLRQSCARCIENVDRELQVELNYILQHLDPSAAKSGDDLVDDVGIVYFDGENIELEELLQESLILNLNQFWHPPEDTKGNCVQCGTNFSKGSALADKPKITLGELLKKAGVEN